jgi:hypothetical protein
MTELRTELTEFLLGIPLRPPQSNSVNSVLNSVIPSRPFPEGKNH